VNEFFGISMTYIMIALLVILGIALSTVAYVIIRNRVMFVIGVRNIPRRRAQTTLIIIGLMLSTLIISTAFAIGDTVDYTITYQAYQELHSVDETVEVSSGDTADLLDGSSGAAGLVSAVPISESQARQQVQRIKDIDGVDGAMAVVRGPASAQNVSKKLADPLVALVGLDPAQMEGFTSDLETIDGQNVTPADLADDEIFANESARDELDIATGDTVMLFVGGQPHEFKVRAILKDRVLSGSIAGTNEGFVLGQRDAEKLFERSGQVDFIAVSNDGGVRDGLRLSDKVTAQIEKQLEGSRLAVTPIKKDQVDTAHDISSVFTTIFVVLGMFSIAAGMLLIFLIFVMLAAERKVEMGMVRAVGTKRSHLVQIFMSEGMIYNLGAAAVGCALGIGVSVIIVRAMEHLFGDDLDLGVQFHVTPRSLIVSYAVGVVLTFLTVTFSSWRIGNLNIVSAIRDIPEESPHADRPRFEGGIRSALGILRWLFFKPRGWRQWLFGPALLVAAAAQVFLSIALFMAAGQLYDTSAIGSVVAVILGVFGGAAMVSAVGTLLYGLSRIFQLGTALTVLGIALVVIAFASNLAAPFGLGISAVVFGVAMVLAQLGAPARPVYTGAGLLLLLAWLAFAGANTPFDRINELNGDIDMFFVSGVCMVLAGTFVIVYNADLMLGLLTLSGGLFSRLAPSIRTAVAYPLANKFRTGMTIAMIALVMFALVMMSTMNENFDRVFLSPEAGGGYDVVAIENPGNPITNIKQSLEDANKTSDDGAFDTSVIAGDDTIEKSNPAVAEIRMPGDKDWSSGAIDGLSPGFLEHNTLRFQSRATGFDSDAAVWQAMGSGKHYAVVDTFMVGGDGFGGGDEFMLEGIEPTDKTFDPVTVQLHDAASGEVLDVQVIGVLTTASSGLFPGLHLSQQVFDGLYDQPLLTVHMLRLQQGANSREVARGIERALLFQGVQADSISKIIDDYRAQSRGFLLLIQGFMGIGLFVGIAAVGVIAFRTVVERRQQIGMLRAIGFTRRAVALSFLLESSFTALLGIVTGITLALLLAYQLMSTDEFMPGGIPSFYIPWWQILGVGGFAFIASLIMTIIPSRQASSIPIAEALRYE